MISDLLGRVLHRDSTVLGGLPAASIITSAILALLTWRVWTFTILPALKPDAPKYLPYWIPFVGHAIPFFNDSNGLISRGRKYFQYSREPFIILVAGEKLVILTSPQDVTEVFKNGTALSFDGLVRTIHKSVANVSDGGFSTLWRTPAQGFTSLHPNPKNQSLVYTGNELLHKQVLPGKPLDDLTTRFLHHIEVTTRRNRFFETSILASSATGLVVSLHAWTRDVLVDAATKAFFGESLTKLLPDMSLVFDQWDMNSWMMTYQYPAFLAKAAIIPRDKLIRALTQYFELPLEERLDAVPFVAELDDEQRNAGLDTPDGARIFMIIYWAINTNAQKSAFWLLAHVLSQPSLAAAICKEVAGAISYPRTDPTTSSETIIDYQYLLESCPHLNSVFNEILRVTSTSANVREVLTPVQLGGKTIPKGAKVFIPHRQLLLDEEGFGPTANQMDPDRFLNDKSLERNGFYRPFGGGSTLCSGRFIARREVLAFVAIVFSRYDIRVVKQGEEVMGVKGKAFPRLDEGKPSLGISMQVPGDDVILHVVERSI